VLSAKTTTDATGRDRAEVHDGGSGGVMSGVSLTRSLPAWRDDGASAEPTVARPERPGESAISGPLRPCAGWGTVRRQIFEGEKIRGFADGDKLGVKVFFADLTGRLTEMIPRALAVTLEVADPTDLTILNEVRERIRLKLGVAPK